MIECIRPSSLLVLFLVFAFFLAAPCLDGQGKKQAEITGAVLFRDRGCTFCHGVGAIGTPKAPALTGLPTDKTWTTEKITDQILNGGQKMPPFRDSVTDEEVSDLIAYLRAKDKPIPPPAAPVSSAAGQPGP